MNSHDMPTLSRSGAPCLPHGDELAMDRPPAGLPLPDDITTLSDYY
jgi:hypothetical protein